MGKKIIWPAVSGLLALSLMMAACAPAATPPTPATPTTPSTPTSPTAPATHVQEPPQKESAAPAPEAPKYGGTLTVAISTDPTAFDSGAAANTGGALVNTVYEQYMNVDWRRGPAGSGISNFNSGANALDDYYGPQLAETWEMPQLGVWIFHIRKGVHWQQPNTEAGRLMAGREMTADDIVSSLKRLLTAPVTWMRSAQPAAMAAASIEKTGPWEVTIKTPVDYWTSFVWLIQGGYNRVYPPEIVAKYGDISNWRNAVGTGPFMLTDYVPGSQLAYVRNPNYWGTNPVGPGKDDKLPYLDAYKELIIPDVSTRTAALRTGKLDFMGGVTLDDWKSLTKTNPKFEYNNYMSIVQWVIGMRIDKKDKPFADVRVRQALMLATDFDSIKNDYFQGQAEINVFPVNKQITDLYQPLSDMPQAVQDLFRYNPDKAKQLLKDAGYPNGFKSTILVSNVPQRIDELAIFKDMWAKVGVQLEINAKDTVVYNGLIANRAGVEEMAYRSLNGAFNIALFIPQYRGTSSSFVNNPPGSDPFIESLWPGINDNIFIDMPKVYQAYKKVTPYVLEQAFYIPFPTPYTYIIWWPWLKNNYGQGTTLTGFQRYYWVDQELKKSMGY